MHPSLSRVPRVPRASRTSLALFAAALAACTGTKTDVGSVERSALSAEEQRQEELALQSRFALQQRLDDVTWPIIRAALPMCGDRVEVQPGVDLVNAHVFPEKLQAPARRLGFGDTLVVIRVAKGSPGERAGLRPGDRVTHVDDKALPVGREAIPAYAKLLLALDSARTRTGRVEPMRYAVRRGRAPALSPDSATPPADTGSATIAVMPDSTCAVFSVAVTDQDLNAWTDGYRVWVTSAMMRFAGTDDELSTVVAHEVGHAAMRHVDAQKKNRRVGAIFGAVLDVAAATQGINTGGSFSNTGANIAMLKFSQDFEREADYVGLYILARTGRPVGGTAEFWRRMARESPNSIRFARSHPTTAERFVRLEQAAAEIASKKEKGEPLLPNRKSE